jgi:ABC-type sugar transport system permease subunit
LRSLPGSLRGQLTLMDWHADTAAWRRRGRAKMRGGLQILVLLLPAILLLVVIYIYPLERGILLSLSDANFAKSPNSWHFVGLENFKRALADPGFLNAVRVNLIFTTISVPLELGAGLAIAELLSSRRLRFPNLYRTLILFPMFVSQVAAAYNWKWLYIDVYGLLNYILGLIGLGPVDWLSASRALLSVIIVDFWRDVPFVMLVFVAGLAAMPEDLFDAGRVDGASRWRLFWHITMPLIQPTLLVVLLIRVMDSLRMFDIVQVMTQGGPAGATDMMSTFIYRRTFEELLPGYGAAMAIIQWLVIAGVALVFVRAFRRGADL